MAAIKLTEQYDLTMWKPVLGYEGRYEVSEKGVRSAKTGVLMSLVRRGGSEGRRYLSCGLRDGRGDSRQHSYHVLLAEAFLGPRPEGAFVLHRDDDPDNNTLNNLYYGSPSQNVHDQVRNGQHRQTQKTACPRGHQFAEGNLVAWAARKGQRLCLACRDAKNILRYRPLDMQEVADACFDELVNGVPNPYRRTLSQALKESRYGCY
jgi:hypothetical protein